MLQSTNETLPVVPPTFWNDQQTQLGVVVVDGVTDGAGTDVGVTDGAGIDVGVTDGAGIDVGVTDGAGSDDGVGVGKQTDIHNSNVENVPPGTKLVHGQL